ncbi:helix-turn-helix transcriptional regulator [Cryptosporangium aurantiacum]|uniref:Transcriptional regulator, LuxR family n=1 Tax=Cryptosporangium aurantiacum TaxID=134849 RepID=A0A1M7TX82_9ACTN|nr:LuxR C-terminal-related transcriptional regulator [Cryptosporangium aurantiacum]SHN75320.1 transcriptional regulator, LuxR family [Cryptosporangium aurantiacum]
MTEVPTNLQSPLTSFVGRRTELETAGRLLARHRLVTVTGPGGAGKTRLVTRVAEGQNGRYADGIWWVDLSAAAGDGAAVAEAVTDAVGVPIVGPPLSALTVHLGGHHALLCLDNAEHLLDPIAEVVQAVLRSCPRVTALVTSREPLGVPGEAILALPPLSDDDALALFADRARLAEPSFVLDETNEAAVRSIVAHLDGIPLALELAAAWLRTLTPQQVEAGLEDRFTLLVRGPRGAQRRQRTLAGSIDWSHALLDDTERAVFRRLAVFTGTFSLPAAQALGAGGVVPAAAVLPTLGRLVDKSLVVADEHDGAYRYRLLETIRAYGMARLVEAGEETALRGRHLDWYLEFAESIEAERERDTDRWRRALLLEYDNLRAALERGLAADDPDAGRRLAAALMWLWHLDRHGREGVGYLRRAIDRAPDERSGLQARLLTGLALVLDTTSPLDLEYDAATRAVDLATEVGDDGLRALSLTLSAVGAFYTDFDAAWHLCEQAHRAARAGEVRFARGGARALQTIILHLRDRHADARTTFDEAVRRDLRHHRGVLSTVLAFQASGALAIGEPARALDLATQALHVAEPLDDYLRVGSARSALARIRALTGDLAGAAEAIAPVVRSVDGVEGEVFIPFFDRAMAALALRRDDPGAAVARLRPAARSTDRGLETWVAGQALPELGAALIIADQPDEASTILGSALVVAQRLGLPASLAEAYSAQGELAAASGERSRALDLHHEALAIRVEHGLRATQPDSLEALAQHGAAIRPSLEDVRALYAAESARAALGLPRPPHQQRAFEATAAELRDALGVPAFDEAAAEGAGRTLDQAVADIRRARGRRGRPATGWSSLTPTELQVVRLVAEGLTNAEVGARLFMSRGTVKTHLSRVFAKLHTANRTELATAAAERAAALDARPVPPE